MALSRLLVARCCSLGRTHSGVGILSVSRPSSSTSDSHHDGNRSVNVFESQYSIHRLYPHSKPNFADNAVEPPQATQKNFNGVLPLEKIQLRYLAPDGTTAENLTANKASKYTKVELRLHVASADWLAKSVRDSFSQLQRHRIDKDGYYVVRSDMTRSQLLNKADVLDRLREAIRAAYRAALAPARSGDLQAAQDEFEAQRKRIDLAARERLREKRISTVNEQQRSHSPNVK